ncbi:unnamed protein product [Linum tenue]|uniref:Uncharacterized protein n=1 Tax=Linum tenue TaxID=586396 RepID=A0AAV0KWI2_9ROSI|nr:unnamed protein product [Linum tenue]
MDRLYRRLLNVILFPVNALVIYECDICPVLTDGSCRGNMRPSTNKSVS